MLPPWSQRMKTFHTILLPCLSRNVNQLLESSRGKTGAGEKLERGAAFSRSPPLDIEGSGNQTRHTPRNFIAMSSTKRREYGRFRSCSFFALFWVLPRKSWLQVVTALVRSLDLYSCPKFCIEVGLSHDETVCRIYTTLWKILGFFILPTKVG